MRTVPLSLAMRFSRLAIAVALLIISLAATSCGTADTVPTPNVPSAVPSIAPSQALSDLAATVTFETVAVSSTPTATEAANALTAVPAPTSVPPPRTDVTTPAAPHSPDRQSPLPNSIPATATATRPAGVPAVAAQNIPSQPPANTTLWLRDGEKLTELATQSAELVGAGLRLAKQGSNYLAEGNILSPEYPADFPFDTAVLSWNATAPAATSLRFELRGRVGDQWTPWYTMGTYGPAGGASQGGQSDNWGEVDVDTLKLRQAATAFQARATLRSQDPSVTPSLQLLALTYNDSRAPLAGPRPTLADGWARELPVPAYSQLVEDPQIANQICRPTSLAMVLNYYGHKKSVAEVAQGVRDRSTGIFGNWPLNTAYAATQGMVAYISRFYSMEQVQNEIAQGRPVIISIRFQPGELRGGPLNTTSGHLVVVRGFTPQGNVIVNDPFGSNPASVRVVYDRRELTSVWLKSGGVVYLVRPAV